MTRKPGLNSAMLLGLAALGVLVGFFTGRFLSTPFESDAFAVCGGVILGVAAYAVVTRGSNRVE
jgi:hypothetical protein